MPRSLALILVTLLLAAASASAQVPDGSARPPTAQEIALGWRVDRVLVKPRAAAKRAAGFDVRAAAVQRGLGVRVLREHTRLGGMQTLAVTGGGLAGKIAALQASGLYEYVERDWIVHASTEPNDPRYASGEQWGLNNTGQSGGANDADIDGPEAWDARHDAPAVIVAVIDTGVRYTHEDIAANMWRNPGESGDGKETNGIDDDGDGWIDNVFGIDAVNHDGNPLDDHSHGTHCAGTVAAIGNNGVGVVGVAWQAQIMACKFLAASGSGSTSDAIVCIDFARSKGAHILSNSWGGGGYSQALRDAIAVARAAGIVFVAAAGNDNRDNDAAANYPSNYEEDNVVAVAATTRTDTRAGFSNFGLGLVEVGAPGSEILSLGHTSDTAYTIKSGTSMATPHVAGALALLKAQFPADNYRQLINRLLRSVNPIPALAGGTLTGGRLNAADALATTTGAPFHDDFAAAPIFTPAKFRLRSSNVAATLELDEPVHLGDASGAASVWWRWTAPASGIVGVSTAGSGLDTLLAVYTGSAVGALTLVASNDDVTPALATSELTFTATAGVTYALAIVGKAGATGLVMCSLGAPPPNDDFANATALTGSTVEVTNASNLYASKETNEPAHAGNAGRASVWWRWTAPEGGVFLASTAGSSFDTLAAVYTGATVDALALVGENDDDTQGGVTTSRILFSAVAGTTYHFAVDGKNGATGSVALLIAKPPVNDAFAERLTLAGTDSGSNLGATKETGEPNHASNTGGVSVWWTWTAPAAMTVVIDTLGSDFDTTLAVYSGSALNALTALASNDDTIGVTSRVSFEAAAGAIYQIAVDGYDGDTGAITLALSVPAPPANDDFANRTAITNLALAATADSEGATKEAGEPDHAGRVGGKSAWWKWTAPGPGTVTFHTTGSSFDTVLAAYVGSAVPALTEVASDDSSISLTSVVSFPVTGGVTYQLAVDGHAGEGGAITLRGSFTVTPVPPVAVPDVLVYVEPGVTTEVDVLFNDTDANSDLLFITGVSDAPADAVVTHDGTVAYFRGGASFAATGVNTFTYTVTDMHGGTATGLATMYRRPIDQWRAVKFGPSAGDPAIAGDGADPNGNGLVNLLEYALGGDPLGADASASILPRVERDPLTARLILSFTRHPEHDDLVLTVHGADAPGGPWTNLARSELGAPFIPMLLGVGAGESSVGNARAVRVSDRYPMSDPDHPQRYLRLEVERP